MVVRRVRAAPWLGGLVGALPSEPPLLLHKTGGGGTHPGLWGGRAAPARRSWHTVAVQETAKSVCCCCCCSIVGTGTSSSLSPGLGAAGRSRRPPGGPAAAPSCWPRSAARPWPWPVSQRGELVEGHSVQLAGRARVSHGARAGSVGACPSRPPRRSLRVGLLQGRMIKISCSLT